MTPLELKVATLNSRLHAVETILLKLNPEVKPELEALFLEYMEEVFAFLRSGSESSILGPEK